LRDLRKFARQTQNRLVIGLFLLVATVGIILIYFLYGKGAALFGLLCLGGVVLLILIIIGFLTLLEILAKHD
jgi:energy-converting hydrogenase Eha subunit E